ncbi:MAG: leucine-rich repeat domain-containing protein [Paramuribaculum sp.]|nr:leucine-rich repeat domain-containing protein [Paramuribaculum sp.]
MFAQIDTSNYTKIEQDGIYYFLDDKYSQAYVCSKHDYPKNYTIYDFEDKEPTYSGCVKIPNVVTYNSKEYAVVSLIDFAFYKCNELEEIIVPSNLVSIERHALSKCGNIKMNIPENLSVLGAYAFKDTYVKNVRTLVLPNAEWILNCALDGSRFDKVTFGSNLKYFYSYIFRNSSIETVEFQGMPDGEPLQTSVHAFYGFKGKEIRLPNQPIKFTYELFNNCPNMERLVFPPVTEHKHIDDFQDVAAIEGRYSDVNDLIYNCPNMKEVVCYATTPPQFHTRWGNVYTDFCIIDKPDCVLKVPFGSEELYRADPVWGKFQIITGFEPDEYTSISSPYAITDNSDAPVEYFNLQGMKVTNTSQGNIYIRRQGTNVEKVIL